MEQKFVFGVLVRDTVSESIVELFDTNLIDEACAFALGLFRSIQKSNLNVVVYQYSDGKDIVTFKRS